MKKKFTDTIRCPKRQGVAGRVPLPGSALASKTFDGFGSKAMIPAPDDSEEDSVMKEYFPDEKEE